MIRPRSRSAETHAALGRSIRELWDEFEEACQRAQSPQARAWRDRYWPPHAPAQGLGGGVTRITPARDGTYLPDPDGQLPAIIIPAWRFQAPGRPDDLIDLLAWVPTTGALLTRRGIADVLGVEALARCTPLMGITDPLVIFSDPGAWAAAHSWDNRGDHGIVVIRWDRVRSMLGHLVGTTEFVVPDLATGRRLRKALTRPDPAHPKILVTTSANEAAA